MSETIEDMENLLVNELGSVIVVDVSGCRLSHCKQIALPHVACLQANLHDKAKARTVQVKLSGSEQRHYSIPVHIDSLGLKTGILSDRVLLSFGRG